MLPTKRTRDCPGAVGSSRITTLKVALLAQATVTPTRTTNMPNVIRIEVAIASITCGSFVRGEPENHSGLFSAGSRITTQNGPKTRILDLANAVQQFRLFGETA